MERFVEIPRGKEPTEEEIADLTAIEQNQPVSMMTPKKAAAQKRQARKDYEELRRHVLGKVDDTKKSISKNPEQRELFK